MFSNTTKSFLLEDTYFGKNSWALNTTMFAGIIFLGLELLTHVVDLFFSRNSKIEVRGKRLDPLEVIDWSCIYSNRCITVVFVYHLITVTMNTPTIKWKLEEVTIGNTFGALVLFYAFYDFFYMCFHRFLHMRFIYPHIHKHHHRQKAPERGNIDAINVHPFEFAVGEYLHLLTVYVIPSHIYTVVFFVAIGGILASLNHTRYDVSIPFLFSVKVHDVHHRIPESNYGQYTMFWDKLCGSYRDYNDDTVIKASGSEADVLKGSKKE